MLTIKSNGLDKAIQILDALPTDLEAKAQEFIKRLAQFGVERAQYYYDTAQYAGGDDKVSVSFTEEGKGVVRVTAEGHAVLYIEFGTGVKYPDDLEARADIISGDVDGRGQHGKRHGASQKGWYYLKEHGIGNNPPPDTEDATKPGMEMFYHTYGNPSEAATYKAKKELRENAERIAREVFGNDR